MASKGTGSHFDSDKTTCTQPSYACFECTHALVCGFEREEVEEIRKAFEAGGGKTYTRFCKPQLPQIIVCGSAGDPTYKEVRKQVGGSEVPAVTKEWVEACIKAKGQVSYSKFQLKPLAGLVISVTNFNHGERVNLQRVILQAGGQYSAQLHKDGNTHLICKTATGAKYQAVLNWQNCLSAVSEQWLHASIKLGYPAPEENFPPPTAGQSTAAAAVRPPAAAAAAPRPNPPVLQSVQGGGNSNDSCVAASSGGPPIAAQPNRQQQQQTTAGQIQQQPQVGGSGAASGRTTRTSGRLKAASTAEASTVAAGQDGASAAAAAAAGNRQDSEQHQQQQQQPVAAAGSAVAAVVEQVDPGLALAIRFHPLYEEGLCFLERVQLWWCGMNSDEESEMRHMLFAFRGVWMPKLNQHTTHVMIGSRASSSELLEVKQYLQSCNRKLNIVSPAWLHYCVSERQLVTDNRGRLALGGLLNHVAAGSAAAAGGGSSGDLGVHSAAATATGGGPGSSSTAAGTTAGTSNILGGVFAQSASRQGFPDAAAQEQQQQQSGWVPEYWLHRPRDQTRLFEGCHFTLAALKGRVQEHEAALDKIRTYSGQIFNHGSTKPPASCPTVFAVCPSSLPPADEQQLVANDSSFRAVHATCRVTLDWLVACVKRSELIRISSCHTPLFAPIRHPLPLSGFDKVSVLVSGYGDADQRKTIMRLAELLGAKVLNKMDKSNLATHLIIPRWGPEPPGAPPLPPAEELKDLQIKKIRFAQKHNVQMVDSFWLAECLSEGRRVTEEYSRPKGVLELLPAAAGGTQAAVASQLPQTQMGTSTQAPAPVIQQPASTAATLGTKCPLPSHRLASSTATVAAAKVPAGEAGGAAVDRRPSNWIREGTIKAAQQQQQQQQDHQRSQMQQQQQQQEEKRSQMQQQQQDQQPLPPQPAVAQQHTSDDAPAPRRSLRKLLESPGKVDTVVAELDQQQQRQKQRQQDQDQQQQDKQTTVPAVLRTAGDVALADVGNTLQAAPPAAPATAENGSGSPGTTTTGVQPAAAGVKVAAAPGGSDGDEDMAKLIANINALGKMASRHDIADGSYASQSVPDMPSLQELTCKMGSGGAAAGSSSGNAGGSGYSLRGKRKTAAGSLGSGGGKSSGSGDLGDVDSNVLEGAESGATAAAAGPAGAAKRPRRSSSSAAAAAMPPPPAKAAGKAAAGPGGRGGGGSRYCPKKGGAAALPESMQMSQQVDYDVGQQPEALLAAAGRRRSQSAVSDEKAKTAMLARVGLLNKKQA